VTIDRFFEFVLNHIWIFFRSIDRSDDEGLEGTYSTTIDVEPEQIQPDYTIYFVIGGLVVVAVLALTVIVRRRKLS